MPPKTPAKPKTPAGPPPEQPDEDELLGRLAEQQFQLQTTKDKLLKIEGVKVELGNENTALRAEVNQHKASLVEANELLTYELAAARATAEDLRRQLAAAQAELAAQRRSAATAAERAAAERAADVSARDERIGELEGRLGEVEHFLAERDGLRARLAEVEAQAESDNRMLHKKMMDLERKHAGDREVWKKETAAAVQKAREEMVALTDERLQLTTKRTILENEQMSSELLYQSRQVQKVVAKNEALEREVGDLRLALDISKGNEQGLALKNRACEKTVESLLARLRQQDAARAADAGVIRQQQRRLEEMEEEVAAAALAVEDKADQVMEMERALATKRKELKELKESYSEAANFLVQCTNDVRQKLLATEGHAAMNAALAAVSAAGGLGSASSVAAESSVQDQKQPVVPLPSLQLQHSTLSAVPSTLHSQPSQQGQQMPKHLHEMSMEQREAVLHLLLQNLHVDWAAKEGVLLPAAIAAASLPPRAASPSPSLGANSSANISRTNLQLPGVAEVIDHSLKSASMATLSSSPSVLPQASLPTLVPSAPELSLGGPVAAAAAAAEADSRAAELLRQLQTDVRPWGQRVQETKAAGRPGAKTTTGRPRTGAER